jgi:antitoxin component YwqK of YwqJK toxin-antitoxin module
MKILFIIFFISIKIGSFGQVDTIYIDIEKSDTVNIYKDGYYVKMKNHKILYEGLYLNNSCVGIWKYYFENGNIQEICEYKADEFGKSNYSGRFSEFYETGILKTEGYYKYPENDTVECVECYYFRDPRKIEYSESKWPLKIGIWKEFHPNGKIKSSGNYYSGIHEYHNKSILERGKSRGVISVGCEYLKHGEWKIFDENGQLVKIEYYVKGIFIGEEEL